MSPLNESDGADSAFSAALTLKVVAQQCGGYDVLTDNAAISVAFDTDAALGQFLDLLDSDPSVYTYEVVTEGDEDAPILDFETMNRGAAARSIVYVYLSSDYVLWDPYEYDEDDDGGSLTEVKRKIKVNSRGKRRIKMQCKPGFRWDPGAKACVKIGGAELATKRRSIRRSLITKRSMGSTFKRRVVRKTKKAMRFRAALGLENKK